MVLAGGRSSRLGLDKAFLRVGTGRPLVEQILSLLARLSDDLIVVANEPEVFAHLGVRIVGDAFPGKGALGGIYSGLAAGRHERSLVVACDMPFLNANLLKYMLSLPSDYDVVIPRHGDGLVETMHTVYTRACLGPIRRQLELGELRVIGFFPSVVVRYVEEPELRLLDPELLSLFNVNTPDQLHQANEIARRLPSQSGQE